MHKLICTIFFLFFSGFIQAHNLHYEELAASTQTVMFHETSDQPVSYTEYAAMADNIIWLISMSRRLEKFIPDIIEREEFLRTVYYEATRAGLDPQLVLSVIQVESGFKKYAISSV